MRYLLFFLILVSGCTLLGARLYQVEFFTPNNIIAMNLEVADDPVSIARGLMFRTQLVENGGMIFIFENATERHFWMKNTYIPLDIIFIDEDSGIISIVENAQPCTLDPCRTYSSNGDAMYVIEVNGGFVRKNNIRVGNLIDIKEEGL